MRILQVCKKFPYPLKDGESIAVTYLASALHQLGCKLTLLVMNTSKHHFDIEKLPSHFNHYEAIHTIDIDNQLKVSDAFFNLFTKESYHVSRYKSKAYEEKLKELLTTQEFDVVQLETLYLAPYVTVIRKYSKAKIALRSHNVEFEIWERITNNTSFGLKKLYLSILTQRLKNFELSHLNSYDWMVAITQRDLDHFRALGCHIQGQVCPIGLNLTNYPKPSPPPSEGFAIGFIGSLDWMPNLEGIEWFLKEVWDKVLAQCPQAVLNIAGRNAPAELMRLQRKNVCIHGEVDSAFEFMTKQNVMIVPLFSGSGMRVKILESMVMGRVTITTTIGLEGIAAKDGEHVLLANNVANFVNQLVWCFEQRTFANDLAEKGRQFIEESYSHRAIAKKLMMNYELRIRN